MITRPLDLSSKLRREPLHFGALFFVNAGLLVLFFSLFGSQFVLAPGLGVDFRLPQVAGANANARPPTHVITVTNAGQIITTSGFWRMEDLPALFKAQAASVRPATLLVRAEAHVPNSMTTEISGAAIAAGFDHVVWAAEEAPAAPKAKAP